MHILLGVLSGLFILLAVFLALMAVLQEPVLRKVLRLSAMYGVAGLLLLSVRLLLFSLPVYLERKRSSVYQRRMEEERSRNVSRRSGGVLVLVLVVLALLAALLVQAQGVARGLLRRAEADAQKDELQRAAADAVWSALRRLADDADLAVDHTNEAWAVCEEVVDPLGVATLVRVDDVQRRFDLNNLAAMPSVGVRAAEDIVQDLLTVCGDFTPVARVAALRDAVDVDSAGGYEADHAARMVPPRRCPNRVLLGEGELLAVEGWTREGLEAPPLASGWERRDVRLVDTVAVVPVARQRPLPVNVNTASREVLVAVAGLGRESLVDSVLALRAIKPLRNLDALALTADAEWFEQVRPWLATASSYFQVEVQAYKAGARAEVRALARRDGAGRVEVVQWLF